MRKTENNLIDPKFIGVLDGIRALSVILVLIFHFWQQTWIFPIIETPFLAPIGLDKIDLSNLARVGFLFVDMLVMLSGFLLFLPVMRQIFLGEDMESWKTYTKKRLARILPSYYFAVLVIFFAVALPNGQYNSIGVPLDPWRDLFTHLTFTHIFSPETYFYTPLPTALWTVAVEVWFYFLFPLFAEMIKRRQGSSGKNPKIVSVVTILILFLAFNLISFWYEKAQVMKPGVLIAAKINQLPAFMGAYANGMLGAMVFVWIAKHCERTKGLAAAATLLSVLSLAYIGRMVNECAWLSGAEQQLWQVTERFRLTAAFMVFILSTALAAKWYRFLFSNRLMHFLAVISYNLYIWHQWLAVYLKRIVRFPYWEGTTPPNQLGDRVWMDKYALVITVAAFAAAIITTYLIEKPFAKLILGKFRRKSAGRPENGSITE